MSDEASNSDSSKTSTPQHGSTNVGQFVPQVFMVPYYAPPHGINTFPQNQQPQQVFGPMPNGMHASPIPMHGMPSSMPFAAIPMKGIPGHTPHTSSSYMPTPFSCIPPSVTKSVSKMTSTSSEQNTLQANVNSKQHVDDQPHFARASWTVAEEELLVNLYMEYMVDSKMKKMKKKTWESVAEKLYKSSKINSAQVTLKTGMQCKDKWNNMIKKYKYHRIDYLRRFSCGGDDRAVQRVGIFDTLEKILNYENNASMCMNREQDNIDDNRGNACMTKESDNADKTLQPAEDGKIQKRENLTTIQSDMNTCKENEILISQQSKDQERKLDADDDDDDDDGDDVDDDDNVFQEKGNDLERNETNENYESLNEVQCLSSSTSENANKRANEETAECSNHKKVKLNTKSNSFDEKSYDILLRQTELIEKMYLQHQELLEQLKQSEENTRMMILQAIKQLGTILERLIKTEK